MKNGLKQHNKLEEYHLALYPIYGNRSEFMKIYHSNGYPQYSYLKWREEE